MFIMGNYEGNDQRLHFRKSLAWRKYPTVSQQQPNRKNTQRVLSILLYVRLKKRKQNVIFNKNRYFITPHENPVK